MDNYLAVGVIVGKHGFKGTLRVLPTTDVIKRFDDLKSILIDDDEPLEYFIERHWYHKNMLMIKLKGIDNEEQAISLKGKRLLVARENAIALEKNEYFQKDLYGMQVISDEGEDLGILDEILETTANDVFIIRKKGEEDLLIPSVDNFIKKIDLDKKIIYVHLMEGIR